MGITPKGLAKIKAGIKRKIDQISDCGGWTKGWAEGKPWCYAAGKQIDSAINELKNLKKRI